MSEWALIEMNPPPAGLNVILFAWSKDRTNWKMDSGFWSVANQCWFMDGRWLDKPYDTLPTHWHPMPEPPK